MLVVDILCAFTDRETAKEALGIVMAEIESCKIERRAHVIETQSKCFKVKCKM
jgi:hypothetical protein